MAANRMMERQPIVGDIWELRDLVDEDRFARWHITDATDPHNPEAILLDSNWTGKYDPGANQPGATGVLAMSLSQKVESSKWVFIKNTIFGPCSICDGKASEHDYLCKKCRGHNG